MTKKLSVILFLIVVSLAASVFGQTAQKATAYPGEVVSTSDNGLTFKTATGDMMAMYSDRTVFKSVPPTNPVLTAAVDAAKSDVGVGDKVIVVGVLSADKKMLQTTKVFIMSKAAIADRNTKESEEWTRRGVSGRVSAVNAEAKQITVDVRGIAGTTSVVVSAEDKVPFRRYAPNSIKYSESVASSLGEIRPGDMLRARGEKSGRRQEFYGGRSDHGCVPDDRRNGKVGRCRS